MASRQVLSLRAERLRVAIDEAIKLSTKSNMLQTHGAVILDRRGNIIARGYNTQFSFKPPFEPRKRLLPYGEGPRGKRKRVQGDVGKRSKLYLRYTC